MGSLCWGMGLGLTPFLFLPFQGLGAPEPQYLNGAHGYHPGVDGDYNQEDTGQLPTIESHQEQGFGPPLYKECPRIGGHLTVDCEYKCEWGQCYVNATSVCFKQTPFGGSSTSQQSVYAPPGRSSKLPPKCRERAGCPDCHRNSPPPPPSLPPPPPPPPPPLPPPPPPPPSPPLPPPPPPEFQQDYNQGDLSIHKLDHQVENHLQGFGPLLYRECPRIGGHLTVDCEYKCDWGQCYVNATSVCFKQSPYGGSSTSQQWFYAPPGPNWKLPPKCRNRLGCPYCQRDPRLRQASRTQPGFQGDYDLGENHKQGNLVLILNI